MIELGVEAGDYIDIDELEEQFKAKGYDADYENLRSYSSGFIAEMTVKNGEEIVKILVEGSDFGHMILDIK